MSNTFSLIMLGFNAVIVLILIAKLLAVKTKYVYQTDLIDTMLPFELLLSVKLFIAVAIAIYMYTFSKYFILFLLTDIFWIATYTTIVVYKFIDFIPTDNSVEVIDIYDDLLRLFSAIVSINLIIVIITYAVIDFKGL